jgi:Protein kinase domain
MALPSGTRMGPYELVAPLGAGGMGEVYRARDERLARDVAIKVLPSGLTSDPERLQRFEREAKAAGALNHPHILAVHDVGRHDGSPYVVSELLVGQTLRVVLGTAGYMSPEQVRESPRSITCCRRPMVGLPVRIRTHLVAALPSARTPMRLTATVRPASPPPQAPPPSNATPR